MMAKNTPRYMKITCLVGSEKNISDGSEDIHHLSFLLKPVLSRFLLILIFLSINLPRFPFKSRDLAWSNVWLLISFYNIRLKIQLSFE